MSPSEIMSMYFFKIIMLVFGCLKTLKILQNKFLLGPTNNYFQMQTLSKTFSTFHHIKNSFLNQNLKNTY